MLAFVDSSLNVNHGANNIVHAWLGNVPEYMPMGVRLIWKSMSPRNPINTNYKHAVQAQYVR
jgi:hypothetical protein